MTEIVSVGDRDWIFWRHHGDGGFISGATPVSYILTGGTGVQTDSVPSRVAATFAGTDPFTWQGNVNSMVLRFGFLAEAGKNYNRSAFVDNYIYGALESPVNPSQINRTNLPLSDSATNANLLPQIAMVTSTTVPNTSLMPPAGSGASWFALLAMGLLYRPGGELTPSLHQFGSNRRAANPDRQHADRAG
jgi:hypothetical protein